MNLYEMKYYLTFIGVLFMGLNLVSQTNIELLSYEPSECKDVFFKNLHKIQNRILEVNKNEYSLDYKICVVTSCNGAEGGSVELKGDTLNLMFHGSRYYRVHTKKVNDSIDEIFEEWVEPMSECKCMYHLLFKIKGLPIKSYVVKANGKRITKSKHKFKLRRTLPAFDVVGNDTINYIDIYGLKQGVHVSYLNDGRLRSKMNYLNDEKISGLDNVNYNFNGYGKVETFMLNKKYTIRKFYNKGKWVKTCDTDGTYDEGTNCKYIN